jgi:hypothetical protein
MGRPTKLLSKTKQRICDLIRKGVPRERAARMAGIGVSTFHRWMASGEEKSGPHREFREAVLRAEDELITRGMAAVVDAFAIGCPECGLEREPGAEDPCPQCKSDRAPRYLHELRDRTAAARFIFPHRFPTEFSTRAEVQATGPGGGPVKVEADVKVRPLVSDEQLGEMSPEQLQAFAAGLVDRVAG